MPGGSPVVELDAEGICNHCREHSSFDFKGEELLKELLNSHRNQESKYDCMVNISGGRDSAYTLLAMVKDYGMSDLAVNYANPFTDE